MYSVSQDIIKKINRGIEDLLSGKKAMPIVCENAPAELQSLVNSYNKLAGAIEEIMLFIYPLAQGNLNIEPPRSQNLLASPFKELHSRLAHLVWQSEQVAKGDYSQRVDFMGDFSAAFNSMIEQLGEKDKLLKEQIKQLTNMYDRMQENELRYRMSFYHSNDAVFIFDPETHKILETNTRFQEILGYTEQDTETLKLFDLFLNPAMFKSDMEHILKTSLHNTSCKLKKKDGSIIDAGLTTSWIDYNNHSVVIVNMTDRTEQLRMQASLAEREELLRMVIEGSNVGFWDWKHSTKKILLSKKIQEFLGYGEEDITITEKSWSGNINPNDLPYVRTMLENHKKLKIPEFSVECRIRNKSGEWIWVLIKGKIVKRDKKNNPLRMTGTLADITERKLAESRLKYLSMHDSLTNLYNRAYFDQELEALKIEGGPVGIIVCDVDGLKLINDTLGHEAGDNTLKACAEILLRTVDKDYDVTRIGGDEFVVILPGCTPSSLAETCGRIRNNIEEYNNDINNLELNLSLGYAYSRDARRIDALFQKADNQMYRDKLLRRVSSRSSIVNTVMQMLKARDVITEDHSSRLEESVYDFGVFLGLSKPVLSDLRLFSKFHDIGKVGLPDTILNKKENLSAEERAVMQTHCIIGQRICKLLPDLSHISELIYKHREWWNGKGYPAGLEGENIPIECRILSIVDAYDAMTNDRPYRQALSHDQAVSELRKYSGTQFDPDLVEKFLIFLNKQENA